MKEYEKCSLCPRNCLVNRTKQAGICGETDKLRISRAALHFWEEPCISGTEGSGAVFFEGCNLKCIYCQNYRIAHSEAGAVISGERLTEIFDELRKEGANNINLVTGTHFIPTIAACIRRAKEKGFSLPFVWNTSSYEKTESLKMLDGLIDIYLPDYKYISPGTAKEYSFAEDYPEVALAAIEEMVRQVGKPVFDEKGHIKKGVIIRHLILPSRTSESIEAIRLLYQRFGEDVYYSLMNQYTPMPENPKKELNRRLTTYEYNKVIEAALSLGMKHGFTQERETQSSSFIPEFDLTGVKKNKKAGENNGYQNL